MSPAVRRLAWLLVPAPVASLAYLFAIRTHLLAPRFAPVVIVGLLPAAVLAASLAGWGGLGPRARVTLGAVAVLEIAWCVVAAAAVGLAIGLASG